MSGTDEEDGKFDIAIELEPLEAATDPFGNTAAEDDDYFDYTAGRHRKQRVVLWRGEDALLQASNALGHQINVIASQVAAQLSPGRGDGHAVDSVELSFGVKVAADAGKVLGVFTVSAERAVQVKITLKRSGPN